MTDADAMRQVWQAALVRAFIDSQWEPPDRNSMTNRAKGERNLSHTMKLAADRWWRSKSRDFREVCHLAGFDPDFLHDAYVSGRINLDALRASESNKKQRGVE